MNHIEEIVANAVFIYNQNPTLEQRKFIVDMAKSIGYYNVWYRAFYGYPEITALFLNSLPIGVEDIEDLINKINKRLVFERLNFEQDFTTKRFHIFATNLSNLKFKDYYISSYSLCEIYKYLLDHEQILDKIKVAARKMKITN